MIITKNGSLIPSVFFGSAGHVMYVVLKQDNIWVKYHYLLLTCDHSIMIERAV